MLRTSTKPTLVPPVLLAACALIELGHAVVLRRTWSNFAFGWTLGFAIALGALWIAAAVGLFLRRSWGWLVGFYASFALAFHGAVLRIGDAPVGVLYFLAGAASVAMLLRHARGSGFHLDPREHRPSLA